MDPIFSIIIPTFNNPQFLQPCVQSIVDTGILSSIGELVIVNNGKQPISEQYKHIPNIRVLEPGENLGWERGLALGVKNTKAPFLCFQNDDTHIPVGNSNFYFHLLYPFSDANVAAVGPSTTVAAGWHSIYQARPLLTQSEVTYLIFFTVMVRRKHYEEVGGIDTSCPGGDDLDLSMRLRKAGKKLLLNPRAFLIHHAFKTGERVNGGPGTPGGWNSQEMHDRTNQYLIQKHGFRYFIETQRGFIPKNETASRDLEGDIVRDFVSQDEQIIELGCGGTKTVERATGVDIIPGGEQVPNLPGVFSVADVVADVSKPLPFEQCSQDAIIARHILEHCVDAIETITNWSRCLRIGGKLVIAVPNQDICNSIPLNPEHVHAFTPKSLGNLMELCGFRAIGAKDPMNGVSFVGLYEKVLHLAPLELTLA